MRLPLVLAAGLLVFGAAALPAGAAEPAAPAVSHAQSHQLDAISAAKRTKKRVRGHQAYGRSGQQIACTQFGCGPIPRGCRIETGRIPFTWEPSGFDDVVCPYYRR
ncbi:MAG TPA: hypothetical protein VD863_06280 [Bradyrhizobium sp.]|nr:hypothetical protein [Bradyrhizobium sp.]